MDSYSKTYENDIYFFLPMTAVDTKRAFRDLSDANMRREDEEEKEENPSFGDSYCDILTDHVLYECNNATFRTLERFYLGQFELACYDDNYDGTVLDVEPVHLFVTAHRKTGLYIVTLAIHDNRYIPTQLIDQMSTDHLDIRRPGEADFVPAEQYLYDRFGLTLCGESKCVACLSNKPEDELELAYILAGETYVSEHIDYHLNDNRVAPLLENHACYDYYESYISRSVIAFVFEDYPDSIFDRLDDEASVLFVVEIVLFQNTAVLRTNRRVVEELDENDGITNAEIEELYLEFGQTMKFWSTDIFKYPFSQLEAEEVIRSFGIDKALDEYHRNQTFIDRLIEIKSNMANEVADGRMNFILYCLAWFEGGAGVLAGFLWALTTFFHVENTTWWTVGTVTVLFTAAVFLWFGVVKGRVQKKKKKR